MKTEAAPMLMRDADRLPGVDVLRGVAATLVVLHHIDIRFRINRFQVAPFLPEGLRDFLMDSGLYSVVCFFVISGFLITRLTLRRWGEPSRIPPLEFYGLRAARILPCLLLVVATSSILHLLQGSPFVIRPDRGTLGGAVFAALGFHINWYEGRNGYLPGNWDVLWSLSVEETFYLLFPILCMSLRKPGAILAVLVPVILIAPLNRVWLRTIVPWDDYSYLSCMDGIALGCIGGWVSERMALRRAVARLCMLAGTAVVLLIIVFRETTLSLGLVASRVHISLLEVGMTLILLAMSAGIGKQMLSRGTGMIRGIGRCSYEIYITHMFVVYSFFIAFRALFGTGLAPSSAVYPLSYACMLILSILLGYVVARWISEPSNRAIRQWLHARRKATGEAPSCRDPPVN